MSKQRHWIEIRDADASTIADLMHHFKPGDQNRNQFPGLVTNIVPKADSCL